MKPIDSLIEKLSAGNPSALLNLYGPDPMVIAEQKERYTSLLTKFSQEFGHTQAAVFSSPGRTEIGGNHTDHNHGRVLAGAVNLDNVAVAAKNNSDSIQILSVGYPAFRVELSALLADPNEQFTSASLVRGVCSRLKELGFAIGGFDAVIDGGVPKGSGLSSSASFEVLIGTILSHLFNDDRLEPITNALAGQYAENHFFGKPCGLMDQTACAVGGFITIDFENPAQPVVNKVDFDFASTGYALVITDTGGNHADLNDAYASLPAEMKSVAAVLGGKVLRDTTLSGIIEALPAIRKAAGDRAILRAYHFHNDNQRVADQVAALEGRDFSTFLRLVTESGYSSFMYNQNIFTNGDGREQGVALALALSEKVLRGKGAWRVHGGGFAGTIQAFVPEPLLGEYVSTLESAFGTGACRKLFIRNSGSVVVEL
jgi:galactokinase